MRASFVFVLGTKDQAATEKKQYGELDPIYVDKNDDMIDGCA